MCLDWTYFYWNWKYCSEIIFKCVNSIVGPIFNTKVVKKYNLWNREQYIYALFIIDKVKLKKKKKKWKTWRKNVNVSFIANQTVTICTVNIQSQYSQLEKRYKDKKLKSYAWTLESAFWSLTEQGQRQRDKGVLIIERARTKTTLRSAFWLFIRQRQKQHAWSWLLIFFYKLNLLF